MEDSGSNDFTYVLLPLSLQKYVSTVLIPDKGRGRGSVERKKGVVHCLQVWSCIRVSGGALYLQQTPLQAKQGAKKKEHLTCMDILNIHQNSKKRAIAFLRTPPQTPPAIHKVSELWVVCAHPTSPEDLNGFIRFSRSQRDLN
jgi:hypothetical protein